MRRSFKAHASNYAWAEVLATLAGFVSFPILTRLLSVGDYGVMNLVASVLGVAVAVGKLGLQHSALRSYAEVQSGRSGYGMAVFDATVLWGMAATGLAATGLTAAGVLVLRGYGFLPPAWSTVLLLAAPLILLRVLDSALTNRLRAEESSGTLALYTTARRYASLAAVVGVLWYWQRDLIGFYGATVAVEALAIAALMFWHFRGSGWPRPSLADSAVYRTLAAFGLPMLFSELSTLVLGMGDRWVIQHLLGADALGVYAAAYNMCDYMRSALLGAMVAAAYPRCVRLWESEGVQGLETFLRKFMHAYVAVAMFMVALMAVAGGELMSLLATSRYRQGGEVAPWVMAGLAVQTVLTIAAVGLFLTKRTKLIMLLVTAAGVLSVAANLVLVPRFGIRGAAFAVLIVFGLLGVVQMALARRQAPVVWPWRSLLLFGAVAAAASATATSLPVPTGVAGPWGTLVWRSAALSLAFVAATWLADPAARAELRAWRTRRAATGADR